MLFYKVPYGKTQMAESCFLCLTPRKDMRTREEDLRWISPHTPFPLKPCSRLLDHVTLADTSAAM